MRWTLPAWWWFAAGGLAIRRRPASGSGVGPDDSVARWVDPFIGNRPVRGKHVSGKPPLPWGMVAASPHSRIGEPAQTQPRGAWPRAGYRDGESDDPRFFGLTHLSGSRFAPDLGAPGGWRVTSGPLATRLRNRTAPRAANKRALARLLLGRAHRAGARASRRAEWRGERGAGPAVCSGRQAFNVPWDRCVASPASWPGRSGPPLRRGVQPNRDRRRLAEPDYSARSSKFTPAGLPSWRAFRPPPRLRRPPGRTMWVSDGPRAPRARPEAWLRFPVGHRSKCRVRHLLRQPSRGAARAQI